MSADDHLSGIQFSGVEKIGHERWDIHATDGIGVVGHLQYSTTASPEISSVGVAPKFQHRGIATELYRRASEHVGSPLGHSASRTKAGDGWSKAVGGKRPEREA